MCRQDADEESREEDLVESDHVHDDHDDHCSASGLEDCLVKFPLLYNLFVCRVLFCFHGVAAASLTGMHDRVLFTVATPFFGSNDVILSLQRLSVKVFNIGLRVSLFLHALSMLLILEGVLHD